VLPQLRSVDHRGPLVEQANHRTQQPGLALPALAQQDDVVTGDQGPFQLWQHGAAEAVHAGPRVLAGGQLGEQVVADLGVQVPVHVAGRAQFTKRSDGRGFAHNLTLTPGTNTADRQSPAHLR